MPLLVIILIIVKVLDSQEFFFNYIMKQLNLSSERRSDVIRDFENVIARYSDYLTETSDKIIYCEYITPKKGKEVIPGMEYDDYVDIYKKDLNGLTYDQILLFLKNTKPEERIEKFKSFLDSRNIAFGADLFTWCN